MQETLGPSHALYSSRGIGVAYDRAIMTTSAKPAQHAHSRTFCCVNALNTASVDEGKTADELNRGSSSASILEAQGTRLSVRARAQPCASDGTQAIPRIRVVSGNNSAVVGAPGHLATNEYVPLLTWPQTPSSPSSGDQLGD